MKNSNPYRFVFAAGGTGGHLYPAIAVAQYIKKLHPESEIVFFGNKDKIESRVVPQYGFEFKNIWISGFYRKFDLRNLLFPVKLIASAFQSLFFMMRFKPRVAVGCGAYVSGPVVWAASVIGSKIILLEQNSYPGIANRLLERKANEIHVAFEESKKYFRFKDKIYVTGNPVRIDLSLIDKNEAAKKFGLDPAKKTVLILGGSLGARSLNESAARIVDLFEKEDLQLIWQTGKLYYDAYKKYDTEKNKTMPFIEDMRAAYSASDLVIARAGATTIAEISALGKAAVLVPSPNVAANHQYFNALALAESNAAVLIEDKNLSSELKNKLIELINDDEKLKKLSDAIKTFSKPEAASVIAQKAIGMAEQIN
ncbi:N-acetylglucosaminyl transferase [Melioribacter roseus P3M-2]|uniref:UDP-N-acetylglucosamine--N-acetylmuramyl-(pentapeptide) pyrophosphoryl-undecaprenol N-acetylglucosamine transferase n=1 Tax=Melioribacter roseus (strain DSM 23840 / JCM 17771 / VKM B-2668 / P3M-2) TaxID=1191523 RepID=I6YSN4_MELRP|nr:undecaprenyldiphospho-muramoylpentapeptide beta-N-acetylglucosaminyltransferase [Melioribacter roseus]AFN73557.1 N-acetylglucosaminyl transferase [Melioribacter roseus P3M-2]